jgi:hypothetical protein
VIFILYEITCILWLFYLDTRCFIRQDKRFYFIYIFLEFQCYNKRRTLSSSSKSSSLDSLYTQLVTLFHKRKILIFVRRGRSLWYTSIFSENPFIFHLNCQIINLCWSRTWHHALHSTSKFYYNESSKLSICIQMLKFCNFKHDKILLTRIEGLTKLINEFLCNFFSWAFRFFDYFWKWAYEILEANSPSNQN